MYSFQFRIFYDSFVFVEKDETKKTHKYTNDNWKSYFIKAQHILLC